MVIERERYEFLVLDYVTNLWLPVETRPFHARAAGDGLSLLATVEQFQTDDTEDFSLDDASDGVDIKLPDIVIYASGEQTPFEIEVLPDWETVPWVVHSDGIQPTRAVRANELDRLEV